VEGAHEIGIGTLILAMTGSGIVAALVTFLVVEHHNTASASAGVSRGQHKDDLVLDLANHFPSANATGSATDLHPSRLDTRHVDPTGRYVVLASVAEATSVSETWPAVNWPMKGMVE
jgi:hypothetical protein